MVSRRVGKFARPCGVQGLLLGLRLGPRRTARSKVRRMGRFGARRVDLGKLGVLESRVVVVGVLRKLSNLLLSWGLGRGGGNRANRIWNIGKLAVIRIWGRQRGRREDIWKVRIGWTGEDVFLII